jgi:hypothetical protein
MPKPLTPADYERIASERKLKWLGGIVTGSDKRTGWECLTCGKVWQTPYKNIQQGHGCPRCGGKEQKTQEDYVKLGEEKGFKWLGPEVRRTFEKTRWLCPTCGQPFPARYNDIREGHGHAPCAHNHLTAARCRQAARARNLAWLGNEPGTTKTLHRWQCRKCNRTFRATYNSVWHDGRTCAYCPKAYDRLRTPPAKYEELAERVGLVWLGPPVINIDTKTQWRSKKCGHSWHQTYRNIEDYATCPLCSRRRKKTEADYTALGSRRGFRCLNPAVANNKIRTSWTCGKRHVFLASYHEIHQGQGCSLCARKQKSNPPQKYVDLAARFQNIAWLGPEVLSIDAITWWECTSEHKHRYEATYRQVKKRRGRCLICKSIARAARGKQKSTAAAQQVLPTKVDRAAKAHPVNREIDYSKEDVDFMRAVQAWSKRTGTRHPNWKEVFVILAGLGYVRGQRANGKGVSEESEFETAMEEHKRASGRLFPTWKQVLTVFRGLGYEKPH